MQKVLINYNKSIKCNNRNNKMGCNKYSIQVIQVDAINSYTVLNKWFLKP